jgi:mycofactocin precursor
MAADQSTTPESDPAVGTSPDDVVEELLVEEVSIDGMCGVY